MMHTGDGFCLALEYYLICVLGMQALQAVSKGFVLISLKNVFYLQKKNLDEQTIITSQKKKFADTFYHLEGNLICIPVFQSI